MSVVVWDQRVRLNVSGCVGSESEAECQWLCGIRE